MGKINLTKLARKFEDTNIRRSNPIPAEPRFSGGLCFVCGEPVFFSNGQAYTWVEIGGERRVSHKKCRKDYFKKLKG